MRERRLEVAVGSQATTALLRIPEGAGPFPVVVHCPGWMSTKDAEHYRRYHEFFAESGIATAIFDYRAYRPSATPPIIDPTDLAADAAATVAEVRQQPEIDGASMVTWGSGAVGAAIALRTAVSDPDVAGCTMLSPIATGDSWLRSMRTDDEFTRLLADLAADRDARAHGAAPAVIAPVNGIVIPPAERANIGFKRDIAGQLVELVALESVERLRTIDAMADVVALRPRPLLLIACRGDTAVAYGDAVALHEAAGTTSQLLTLEHTSSYRMHQTHWREIARAIGEFVRVAATSTAGAVGDPLPNGEGPEGDANQPPATTEDRT